MKEKSLLDQVKYPSDLRKLNVADLKQLAIELRKELIDVVSVTGGHLGAGLGVVELTIALHYVFDTPKDKLVWDVGHQAYPHKIITGRRDNIRTYEKVEVFPVLLKDLKANMILLVQHIVQLLFLQH